MTKSTERPKMTASLRYRLLRDITEEVRGTLDLDEMLNHIIDAIGTVIPYDAAGIFILQKEFIRISGSRVRNVITSMAMRGFPKRPRDDDPMLSLGKGIIGYVIRTGNTVIAPDVRIDPNYIAGRRQTLSEIAVPIMVADHVIGALNLESDRLNAFGKSDAEVLHFLSNVAAFSIEKALLYRQLLGKKQLEDQLKLAHDVQANLLPLGPPMLTGYEIAAVNIPNFNVGGDYFDFIKLQGGNHGFVVADVCGSGVPAALIMATFRAALRTELIYHPDITEALRETNRFLRDSTNAKTFVTAVLGVLEPKTGRFTCTNCGHPPPFLLRANGDAQVLDRGGMALAMTVEPKYRARAVTIRQNDLLVLYTDGVVELADGNGKGFGLQGLERCIRANCRLSLPEILEKVVQETRTMTNGYGYDDDFTLVLVRRQSQAAMEQ